MSATALALTEQDFTYIVVYDETDERWVCTVREIPYVVTTGTSAQDALESMLEVVPVFMMDWGPSEPSKGESA